jgi:putative ABC transport system permease protein
MVRATRGRRCALGAPRWVITVLMVTRATIGALLGATLGTALGTTLTLRTGQTPAWTFTTGTAILAVLTAAISTIPPAVIAARQDPVHVLRTP